VRNKANDGPEALGMRIAEFGLRNGKGRQQVVRNKANTPTGGGLLLWRPNILGCWPVGGNQHIRCEETQNVASLQRAGCVKQSQRSRLTRAGSLAKGLPSGGPAGMLSHSFWWSKVNGNICDRVE